VATSLPRGAGIKKLAGAVFGPHSESRYLLICAADARQLFPPGADRMLNSEILSFSVHQPTNRSSGHDAFASEDKIVPTMTVNQFRFATVVIGGILVLLFVGCGTKNQPTAGPDVLPDVAAAADEAPSANISDQSSSANAAASNFNSSQNSVNSGGDNTNAAADESPSSHTDPRQPSPSNSPELQQPSLTARRRLPDDRPDNNAARLLAAGIKRYESERLILLTDVSDEEVSKLPALADRLFEKLTEHFGDLPQAFDGSGFQVTGHLISDEARFRSAGLMPQKGFTFKHGRHLNYQFWIFDSEFDYYRRHLLFHEFIHCFMTCESGMQNIPSLWYIEGMAEYFGTHRLHTNGRIEFGILPEQFDGYEGWGRISELRRTFERRPAANSTAAQQLAIPTLNEVMPDTVNNFQQDSQYATSWALCWMLNSHPKYMQLSAALTPMKTRRKFVRAVAGFRDSDQPRFNVDWLLTIESLLENFDLERSFAVHSDSVFSSVDLAASGPQPISLRADRGWQDTGLRLVAGDSVKLVCTGRYSVDDQPTAWISEPQGVSIRYVRGLPLGQVVATLVRTDGSSLTNRIPVGREAILTASENVAVWLQVNDTSDSRSNNLGTADILISVP